MVPILTYHSIDCSGSVISTSPDRFRRQMKHLRESSTLVLSVGDVARQLKDHRKLPSNAVAITFDDGYRNFYEHAFPILQEYGYPATVFLVPGLCGGASNWGTESRPAPKLDLLDWAQVEEMSGHGVEFGAHSMTHADLSTLRPEPARSEIAHSKDAIEQRLGRRVEAFAWPFGRSHKELLGFVRDNFEAVCTVTMDFVTSKSDRHALPRIEMYYFSRNNLFLRLGTASFNRYVQLRKNLRSMSGLFTSR